MLRFFRSSQTIVLLVIFLLGGLTWMHVLLHPEKIPVSYQYSTSLFQAIAGLKTDIPLLPVSCGLFLTLLGALLLIYVNNRLHLIDKISYLPALCFILLIGGVPMIHQFNSLNFAVILLMMAFMQIIDSFKSEQLSYNYFTASILISSAMFFYQYMYIYMLMVWFAIIFCRPSYWREWIFTILGFLLPVFIVFSWNFLLYDDYAYIARFFEKAFTIERSTPQLSVSTIIFFCLSIFVGIIIFRHLIKYLGSRKILIRNGYYVLIFIAAVTLVLGAIVPDTLPSLWYLMALPLSFFLSNYLATVKSNKWGTIVLASLFLGVFITQFIFLVSQT